MKNSNIQKSFEASQTTTGSTPDSTGGSTARSTCPECGSTRNWKSWTNEELKLITELNGINLIFKHYRGVNRKPENINPESITFFNVNFPDRSPESVYAKAWSVRRAQIKKKKNLKNGKWT